MSDYWSRQFGTPREFQKQEPEPKEYVLVSKTNDQAIDKIKELLRDHAGLFALCHIRDKSSWAIPVPVRLSTHIRKIIEETQEPISVSDKI